MKNLNFIKTKYIFFTLIITYVVIISIFIKYSEFNSDTIKDVFLITTSFTTLIIALLLFDRFNFRKIVFEKKLNLVIELIELIKATKISFDYNNILDKKNMMGSLFIDRNEINTFLKANHLNNNSFVVFEIKNVNNYLDCVKKIKGNPFFPKELIKSLTFLNNNYFESIENNEIYQNESVNIFFNYEKNNDENIFVRFENDIKLKEFLNNYLNLLNEIEIWINKYSNFEIDLNF